MKRTFFFLLVLTALLASLTGTLPAQAQGCTDAAGNPIPCPESGSGGATGVVYRFLGVDENFLNPANWSLGGRIPSTAEDAIIDGLTARIFPTDPTPIPLGDVTLRNGAALIVRNARLSAGRIDSEGSSIELYNSYLKADTFRDPLGGFNMNPSYLEANTIIIDKPETTGRFGLGGADPADPDHLGEGRYANMRGKKVQLDGQLEVFFVYGFKPEDGQRFVIINVDGTRIGEFRNAPEGGRVGGYCDIALTLTYKGGNGNDVELRASRVADPDPKWGCLSDWPQGDPPAPNDDVLLKNQFATYTGDLTLRNLTIRDDSTFILRDATVTASRVDSEGSLSEMYNSYLKADTFRDPAGFNMNPSYLEANTIIIDKPETTIRLGLGGDQPARPDGLGAGRYANMRGGFVQLDGDLEVFFVYGFQPEDGQRFVIVTVDGTRIGEFRNAPEGGRVGGYCDIALTLTYKGGDGNDVELRASRVADPDPKWGCLSAWPQGDLPAPNSDLFLRNQSGELTGSHALGNVTLREGSTLILREATVTASHVDSEGSSFEMYSSYLKADVFRDPVGGFSMNPSYLEANTIIIDNPDTTGRFGLGGAEPADPDHLGAGRYANMRGTLVQLDGNLEVFFVYGFQPEDGQRFIIVNVDGTRIGEFRNAPEGAVVGGYCDIALTISYNGGDGNDVELIAQTSADPDPAWECDPAEAAQPTSVPATEAAPASPAAGSSNTWLFLVIGAVIVVMAMVILRKRK